MPFDDETLLSAYLDGELDPARRQMVESALRSSPSLAGRLRDLARVRDAVQALGPPPMPLDLAPAILQNLQNAQVLHLRQLQARRFWRRAALTLGPAVGVAAALLVAWSFHGFGSGDDSPKPPTVVRPSVVPGDPLPEVVQVDEPKEPVDVEPSPRPPEPAPALVAEVDPQREQAQIGDQEALREILRQPEARRILVPVDVMDNASEQRVEDAIELTARTHPRHVRLRLYQGVAIDPRHPDRAVVYAMILDPTEAGNLRRNLSKSFQDASLSESSVPPATLAQLTETVHLDVFETAPAGSILAHAPGSEDHHHAMKSNSDEPRTAVQDVAPDGFGTGSFPALAPGHRRVRQPDADPSIAAADPDRHEEEHQDTVYLVWLYERARPEDPRRD